VVYRYPDVAVSCHPEDTSVEGEDLDYISFPTLVMDVLSDSTARTDRTSKFEEYRTIPTLREYVWPRPGARWCVCTATSPPTPGPQ